MKRKRPAYIEEQKALLSDTKRYLSSGLEAAFAKAQRKLERVKVCEQCGKTFWAKSPNEDVPFCSATCRRAYREGRAVPYLPEASQDGDAASQPDMRPEADNLDSTALPDGQQHAAQLDAICSAAAEGRRDLQELKAMVQALSAAVAEGFAKQGERKEGGLAQQEIKEEPNPGADSAEVIRSLQAENAGLKALLQQTEIRKAELEREVENLLFQLREKQSC